ncbi:protein-lysine methyltransferase [Acrasis kona]|uniref:Protein-lysine methyltransferase n=1 Tax=Acrasis kona TaxID=1008807 RepID=A0AAW2ZI53_9EUKA
MSEDKRTFLKGMAKWCAISSVSAFTVTGLYSIARNQQRGKLYNAALWSSRAGYASAIYYCIDTTLKKYNIFDKRIIEHAISGAGTGAIISAVTTASLKNVLASSISMGTLSAISYLAYQQFVLWKINKALTKHGHLEQKSTMSQKMNNYAKNISDKFELPIWIKEPDPELKMITEEAGRYKAAREIEARKWREEQKQPENEKEI